LVYKNYHHEGVYLLHAIACISLSICTRLFGSVVVDLLQNGVNSIGLALAGGGNRATSTCTGILRGFQQHQIKTKDGKTCPAMDAVQYNSGISGGSIPAALYTFAQVPTNKLLETDRLVDPEAITPELLETLPKTSMLGYAITKDPLRLPKVSMLPFLLGKIFKVHVSLLRICNCVWYGRRGRHSTDAVLAFSLSVLFSIRYFKTVLMVWDIVPKLHDALQHPKEPILCF
jgi:hypothetical protein